MKNLILFLITCSFFIGCKETHRSASKSASDCLMVNVAGYGVVPLNDPMQITDVMELSDSVDIFHYNADTGKSWTVYAFQNISDNGTVVHDPAFTMRRAVLVSKCK